MSARPYLFASEPASESYPDKLADKISDAILDAFLSREATAKAACDRAARRRRISPASTPEQGRSIGRLHRPTAKPAVLYVDVPRVQCVRLDKSTARLDIVTHQCGEDFVCDDGVVDLHPQQAAHRRIHRRLP